MDKELKEIKEFQKKYQSIIKDTKLSKEDKEVKINEQTKMWEVWYINNYGKEHIPGDNGMCDCGKYISGNYNDAMKNYII